jgi:NAD(P)-dependent dehydrogenase (short-subunit alcohol dehydrogenase family)
MGSMGVDRSVLASTVVVTGGNRGIGYAVAERLVRQGCRVVLVARDEQRGRSARTALAAIGPGDVDLVVGDLSSAGAVRALGGALTQACPRIDVLVHNAGVWPARLVRNEDGIEQAFAVNHLAPFLLNHLLERRLIASGARVVQVSAGIYPAGRVELDRTPTGSDFSALRTYATTKLCNLLLVPLFAERWKDTGVTINAVHPGVIRTGLGAADGPAGYALKVVKLLWKSPRRGAQPVVRLARDPDLAGVTGRYFNIDREAPLAPVARDSALAQRLWAQARQLTGAADAPTPTHLG